MKIFSLVAFLLVSFTSTAVTADSFKDKTEINEFIQKVSTHMGKGETAEGLALLKPYVIVPPEEFDVSINKLKLQESMIAQRFGGVVGVEILGYKEVGDSLLLATFLQKYENHAMQWKIYFYKSEDEWIINIYNSNDQIQSLFEN